mmetsp:Transcript_43419/g.90603  ORF Transcript_43419/g.90603 Transcript_43419/m.90603 type:complete len:260 (+) Transcript_43419:3-782(+)
MMHLASDASSCDVSTVVAAAAAHGAAALLLPADAVCAAVLSRTPPLAASAARWPTQWPASWQLPVAGRAACAAALGAASAHAHDVTLAARSLAHAPLPVLLLLPPAVSAIAAALPLGRVDACVLLGGRVLPLGEREALRRAGLAPHAVSALLLPRERGAALRLATRQNDAIDIFVARGSVHAEVSESSSAAVQTVVVGATGGSEAGGGAPSGVVRGCHRPDAEEDHSCTVHSDCGVAEEGCVSRKCSPHKFCFTPRKRS